MTSFRCAVLSLALCAPFTLAGHAHASLVAGVTSGDTTQFSVSDKTAIPGKTLKAGTYQIRVADHLNDRMIVQVITPGKGEPITFLALPKSGLPAGAQGPITLKAKGKTALRGFVFPDGTVAEFVYPKAEAVSLARENGTTIPAVDPVSEGRSANPQLSRTDMEMVTLWMLTPTPVGPTTGIAAARYEQPPTGNQTGAQQAPASAIASSSASGSQGGGSEPSGGQSTRSTTRSTYRQQPSDTAPVQMARATPPPMPRAPRRRPAVAALPHTASNAPLLELAGTLSLCAAGLLSLRRRRLDM